MILFLSVRLLIGALGGLGNNQVFRALACISDGHCELVSRRRNSYKSFGELCGHLAKLKVKNAVIDGQPVCLDSEGRSIFK